MKKALQPAVPKEELDKHIETTRRELRRLTKSYKDGYLTRDELHRLFNTKIPEGFFKYLESRGLKIYPHIKKNWHRFLEDYDLYKRNMEPDSQIEEPWLRYYEQSDFKTAYEANTADKISFFILMEEFQIPAAYFKPLPEHCLVPDQRMGHVLHGADTEARIGYRLADAGGLDAEENPIGKSFTLVDENGLKAEFKIKGKAHTAEYHAAYSAFGTIEGYTSKRKRKIDITPIEDNRIYFFTELRDDDREAHRECPLWAEYFRQTDQWYGLQQEISKKLIDYYVWQY